MEHQNNNLNSQPTETVMEIKPRRRIWRTVRIPLAVVLILYIGLVIYRIPAVEERIRTEEAVNKIHAQKITLADVMGENLPPEPDPVLKDTAIEGIDVNGNGIRDDVELAIFKLYPDSARIRAAELQYATALQMEMTKDVFNSETLVATIQEEGRGNVCILDLKRTKEVEEIVFNTDIRKKNREDLYKEFMTSYTLPSSDYCDIDPETLPN